MDYLIIKILIFLGKLSPKIGIQLNLFENTDNEEILGDTINEIKDKYGKNYIFRGISATEKATALKRNKLIGGHNAE